MTLHLHYAAPQRHCQPPSTGNEAVAAPSTKPPSRRLRSRLGPQLRSTSTGHDVAFQTSIKPSSVLHSPQAPNRTGCFAELPVAVRRPRVNVVAECRIQQPILRNHRILHLYTLSSSNTPRLIAGILFPSTANVLSDLIGCLQCCLIEFVNSSYG